MKANRVVWPVAMALVSLGSFLSVAQEASGNVPNQPIHVIVGNAAGGGNDILARLIGQKLSDWLGQPAVLGYAALLAMAATLT